jgi:hypothetical protein
LERTGPLNELQLKILGLVGSGDDLSGVEAVGFRNTARALQSRGLVAVSKAGGRWRATVTDAGRYYLEHGNHPDTAADDAEPALQPPRQRGRPESVESSDTGKAAARRPRYSRPAAPGERRDDASALVTRLVQDGAIDLLSLTESEQRRWRKTIDYAKRHHLVPEGHRIETSSFGSTGTLTIRLTTAIRTGRQRNLNLPPVIVSEELDNLHPVIARLRDSPERLTMPAGARARCLRILQAIAAAAIEREWSVTEHPVDLDGALTDVVRTARCRVGAIRIGLESHTIAVAIDQKHPLSPDQTKGEHLKITLPESYSGSQSTWSDGKTGALEQRLPEVIEALAQRAAAERERLAAATRAAAAEQQAREAELARAKVQARERFYGKELERQALAFERWRRLTAYCDQLEAHLQAADPEAPGTESARSWLAWAREHTAAVDPFSELPGMPEVPEFGPDSLSPFITAQYSSDPIPDVFAGSRPARFSRPGMWESGRRFHSNG